ncbi:uncharacterized protein [Dermacentor andersoni]|uniref:uncharacterized protein n=1 Tax=Dermacentor andersoni TaxID=34620 RepID=UPI002416E92A|nr:uncharacterized protein LOC129387006 isoform X2 [Dermacentor andersoni]
MMMDGGNFNTDRQGRNITECVSAQTLSADEGKHEIKQELSYYNKSSKQWVTLQKNFTAEAWGTGTTSMNFFKSPSPYGLLTYLILHADEDCLLVKLVYRSTVKLRACELLVRESYFRHTESSKCCDYWYEINCDPVVQTLYNPGKCPALGKTKEG